MKKILILTASLSLSATVVAGPGAVDVRPIDVDHVKVDAIEIKEVRPIDPPGGSGGTGGTNAPSTVEGQNNLTFTPPGTSRDGASNEGHASLEEALQALGIPHGDDPTARFSEALQLVQGVRQELAQLRAEERQTHSELLSLEQALAEAKTQPWKDTSELRGTLRIAREAYQTAQAKAMRIQARADQMEQALGTLVQWVGAVAASDAAHALPPTPSPTP